MKGLTELRPLHPSFVDQALAAAEQIGMRRRERWTFDVVEDLGAFRGILPIRGTSPSGSRLFVATDLPGKLLITPLVPPGDEAVIRRRERLLQRQIPAVMPNIPTATKRFIGDVLRIRAVRWIEHDFFQIDTDSGTLAAFVQYLQHDRLKFLGLGLAIGDPERARISRRIAAPALPLACPARVIWGGSTMRSNAHHLSLTQRYAVDIEPLGDDIATVLAPVCGVVEKVVDGYDDAAPADDPSRAEEPFGNHVVIAHDGRRVVVAHLRRGSVAVRPGQPLRARTELGVVGNSGRSWFPHVHVHACESEPPHHAVPMLFEAYGGPPAELERGTFVNR